MKTALLYGRGAIELELPDDTRVYETSFSAPAGPASDLVLAACSDPVDTRPLTDALAARRTGDVVVVVSDITRPIPYPTFLPELLAEIEGAGVAHNEILILIATGMHRPSTPAEREQILGDCGMMYRVLDHEAENESQLADVSGTSAAGAPVRLNRHYVEAGFRMLTGLVEPHFMAGFSGGRKSVCPGLASLDTVQRFHGAEFLANPKARNGQLAGNPCHREAISIAQLAPPDFSVNVVLNQARTVVTAFAGAWERAHEVACSFVRQHACPTVEREADVAITSSGGYPLDATFYQCVKGIVSCLPTVRRSGKLVAFGACTEGLGSPEFAGLLERYAGEWGPFLKAIREPGFFVKDQWQFQMQTRALEKVGQENLNVFTHGLADRDMAILNATSHSAPEDQIQALAQALVNKLTAEANYVAVIPEGPYCAPTA